MSLYTFDTIPLDTFIAATERQAPGLLVIEGEYTPEQLEAAFTDLMTDYQDATADRTQKYRESIRNDLLTLRIRQGTAKTLCLLLQQYGYNESIAGAISILDEDITIKSDSFEKDLKRAFVKIATYDIEATPLEDILQEQSPTGEGKDLRRFFIRALARLSAYYKFPIPMQGLLLATYCTYLTDCIEQQHQLKMEHGKHNTGT